MGHSKLSGHLYVIGYEDGICKIGYTSNPKNRFASIRKYRPTVNIEQIYIGNEVKDAMWAEHLAHAALKESGINPIDKTHREAFKIDFDNAVKCVQAIAPDNKPEIYTNREEVVKKFPRVETAVEAMDRVLGSILNILRECH